MAKQTVDIGQAPNDGTGDPLRIAMDKINDNMNEIYRSIGGLGSTTLLNMVATNVPSGTAPTLSVQNVWNPISFKIDTEAELWALSPGAYHGCIAHVHETGGMYYAHGKWNKMLTDNANNDVGSYADSLSNVAYTGMLTDANNSGFDLLSIDGIADGTVNQVLSTDGSGTFTFVDQSGGQQVAGGANTFGTISVAGSLDVVADSLTDSLTLVAGSGMTITANSVSDSITFTSTAVGGAGGAANTFSTIAVAGQSSVVADSTADTLNLAAGTGIAITTNAATDEVTIAASGGGGAGAVRVSQTVASASIADDAEADIEFANLGVSYCLYSVQTDYASRVRIYKDVASRTADQSRPQGTDPVEGSGVIAEFITSSANTFVTTPAIFGFVDNRPTETEIPVRVTNLSGSTYPITITLAGLKLESA